MTSHRPNLLSTVATTLADPSTAGSTEGGSESLTSFPPSKSDPPGTHARVEISKRPAWCA
jgi:hypothetical protein